MIEKYLIWSRALESAKQEIESAEMIIIINKELQRVAEEKLKHLKKPIFNESKSQKDKPEGTG